MDFRLLDPNAAARGVEQVNAWADAAAKRRAGGMIATDPAAAEAHLNRNGLLGDAMNVRQNVWAEENRSIAATERERAGEDRQREIQMVEEKREADALGAMTTNLQAVLAERGPQALLPAFDTMARSWIASGASQEEIAQLRAGLEADPEGTLLTVGGAVEEANQRFQVWQAGGSVGTFDKRTGVIQEQFRADRFEEFDPTKNVYRVPGFGGASGGAGAPAGARPATAPASREAALRATTTPDAIKELFPNARITGGDRDPETNASVNGAERSWHLQPGKAVDMAPIPGETVETVKARLEAAGWTVHEALDETKNTRGTGPHWHFAATPPSGGGGGAAPSPTTQQVPAEMEPIQRATPRPTTPPARFRPITDAERQQYNLPAGASAQINEATGQLQVLGGASQRGGTTGQPGGRLSPQDNAYLVKLRTDAAQLNGIANLYAQMEPLARNVDTGGLMAMPGAGTVVGSLNPEVRRFMQLTDQMTPGMRQGLPGAASDRDVAMFRSATPSIDKPRETNLAAIAAGRAWAKRQGDFVAFMEHYARNNGGLLGATEEWNRYTDANPLFSDEDGTHGMPTVARVTPWRQWFGGQPGQAAPTGAPAPRPQSGSPQRRVWNPQTQRLE